MQCIENKWIHAKLVGHKIYFVLKDYRPKLYYLYRKIDIKLLFLKEEKQLKRIFLFQCLFILENIINIKNPF